MSGARPIVVARRPAPGVPRPYAFPPVERIRLDNGLGLVICHLAGRPLIAVSLVVAGGASDEPDDRAGATILMARGLTEGTAKHGAVELVEATERLGAALHAEAGWDAMSVSAEAPADRLPAVLDLMAEVFATPTFPASEIERLRDERLNDLLQAQADPRRRAEEAFIETIYDPASPYHRPGGGLRGTVEGLDVDAVRAEHDRRFNPGAMSLVVGGDLSGLDVAALAAARFGAWRPSGAHQRFGSVDATPAPATRRIRIVHRPGAVQTEIRIGHVGLARRIDDYHAVGVMSAILGGLFNSRLNRKLREEKGYTYGAGAGFDFRRAAGPFGARAAVNTEVTVPAIVDILAELEAIRESPVSAAELSDARNYLVGVFPLRFETPGAVVGALSTLVVHDLPDDELARYRAAIEAVTAADVQRAARAHVRPAEAAIVLVGDADAFAAELEATGLGSVSIERDAASPEAANVLGD